MMIHRFVIEICDCWLKPLITGQIIEHPGLSLALSDLKRTQLYRIGFFCFFFKLIILVEVLVLNGFKSDFFYSEIDVVRWPECSRL